MNKYFLGLVLFPAITYGALPAPRVWTVLGGTRATVPQLRDWAERHIAELQNYLLNIHAIIKPQIFVSNPDTITSLMLVIECMPKEMCSIIVDYALPYKQEYIDNL